jgi:hypothetical protein
MSTFVYINGRPDHMKGYHDDLLMSIAMCVYAGTRSFKDLQKSKGKAKAMIESWATSETTTEDLGALEGAIGFYTDNSRQQNQDPKQMMQENMWLFGGMPGFKKRR